MTLLRMFRTFLLVIITMTMTMTMLDLLTGDNHDDEEDDPPSC
jgi:hypothetical protein